MSHTVEEATSRRLAFAGIDLETRDELRRLWPTVEPKLDGILQHFYAHVVSEPDLKALIGMRQASLESAQKAHWKRLFSGTFDAEYLSSINRIGRAHVKIGLEPRWYIAGYQHVLNALVEVVLQRHRFSLWRANKAVAALNKAVMIDLDFAISTYQEILIEREENRTRHLSQAIDRFEANVEVALSTVENAATSMKGQADQLLEVADSASREAVSASTASDETSIGVQTVAAATEELVGSIHEISRQISGATDVARRATDTAGNASSEIERLSFAAQKIGDVVGLIQAIAEQTNLLALNATIEAARAGEAGRGFAIVAQEVKDLASQTSRATEDISAQISEVQTVTGRAVDTIGATASTVGEIDALTAAIAAAVEQQGTATQEISVNIQQAASGSSTLARNVTSVNEAIARTGDTASEFLNVSDNLLAQSGTITSMVRAFFSEIRDEEASNADDVDNARVVGDGAMTTSAHGRAA